MTCYPAIILAAHLSADVLKRCFWVSDDPRGVSPAHPVAR